MSGVSQPTIARIESGITVPRVDTLNRLLEACDETLISVPAPGGATERALTRHLLEGSSTKHIAMLLDEWMLPDRQHDGAASHFAAAARDADQGRRHLRR